MINLIQRGNIEIFFYPCEFSASSILIFDFLPGFSLVFLVKNGGCVFRMVLQNVSKNGLKSF